jgi:hypothetical protein
MARKGKEVEDTTAKSGTSIGDTFAKMRDFMQGPVAVFQAVTDGIRQVMAVGKDFIDAYAVQEKAVSNLNAVLAATGGSVGKSSKELQDMASALQEVTLFGDEEIIPDEVLNKLTKPQLIQYMKGEIGIEYEEVDGKYTFTINNVEDIN